MDNSQEFLELYKKLESAIQTRYGYDPSKGGVVAQYATDGNVPNTLRRNLNLCREVRNLIQHQPKVNDETPVLPSQGMLDVLKDAIDLVENPPRISAIQINRSDIYSCEIGDAVLPAMQAMADKSYTHIPILEGGRVKGVFSENTLLSYILDQKIVGIEEPTIFADIEQYLPIESHVSETFSFIPRDALISEAKQRFDEALREGKRLGMLFVTNSGKSTEKLLGILTVWDVAGIE